MNIALFHNLPSGGAKRALYELTRLLSESGHTCDLYTLSLSNETFLPLSPYVRHVSTTHVQPFQLWHTRLLPFLIQYLNFPRKIQYLRHLKSIYARIAQQIDRKEYDVVFVQHCQIVQSPYLLR